MPDYYKKVSSTKKVFPKPEVMEQYERPIGPTRPTTEEKVRSAISRVTGNQTVQKAGNYIKERASEISHEIETPQRERREYPNSGQRRSSSPIQTMNMGPMPGGDLFGVGNYHGFMSDQVKRSRAPPQEAPKKRKRRKKRAAAPPRSMRPNPGPQMTGIPKGMEWMF